ncbi:MAG: hypothetical protein PVI23_14275 [Maricaulaceae bacterium]|jgi:hypothetical protein
MKRILLLAAGMALSVPAGALAQTYEIGVQISADDVVVSRGDLRISAAGIRAYANRLLIYVPADVLADYMTLGDPGRDVNDRPSTVSSAPGGASVASDVGGAAVASELAVASTSDLPVDPVDANTRAEVVYDLGAGRRIEIDHDNRTFHVADMTYTMDNPGASIIAGAPEGAQPDQTAALSNLLNQFTRPRLNPQDEITTTATGETGTVVINGRAVDCLWHTLSRMGGEYGRACLADPDHVPNGPAVFLLIRGLPLEAADKDDIVSTMRQLAETGRLPVSFSDDQYDLPVTISYVEELQEPAASGDGEITDAEVDPELARRLAVTEAQIRAVLPDYREDIQ